MRAFQTVNFVTGKLAVGGRYFWPRRLKRAGITHVLSARRRPDTLDGFVCFSNPMADEGLDQPAGYWRRTVEFALEVLSGPDHKLYVHCAAGKNRGPAHAYAILLALGHPPDEARTLIRKARRKATARYFDDVEAAILRPAPMNRPGSSWCRGTLAPTVRRPDTGSLTSPIAASEPERTTCAIERLKPARSAEPG